MFAVFGIGLALYGIRSPGLTHTQTIAAGTMDQYRPLITVHPSHLPQDLQLDLEKNTEDEKIDSGLSTVVDSLNGVITQLETKVKATTKNVVKGPAPPTIVKTRVKFIEHHTTDTIHVPVYYIATQVDTKEESTGQCTPIYEVRKVDEICPQTLNSSDRNVNEHGSSVSD